MDSIAFIRIRRDANGDRSWHFLEQQWGTPLFRPRRRWACGGARLVSPALLWRWAPWVSATPSRVSRRLSEPTGSIGGELRRWQRDGHAGARGGRRAFEQMGAARRRGQQARNGRQPGRPDGVPRNAGWVHPAVFRDGGHGREPPRLPERGLRPLARLRGPIAIPNCLACLPWGRSCRVSSL